MKGANLETPFPFPKVPRLSDMLAELLDAEKDEDMLREAWDDLDLIDVCTSELDTLGIGDESSDSSSIFFSFAFRTDLIQAGTAPVLSGKTDCLDGAVKGDARGVGADVFELVVEGAMKGFEVVGESSPTREIVLGGCVDLKRGVIL